MMAQFEDVPHAGIRSLVPYKPGKSIEELAQEQKMSNIIKLASNENPLGCSPKALLALQQMSPGALATYPSPGYHPLVPRLAAHLKLDKEQIFVSNGSDYICTILLTSFALHLNKHILTHDYAFSTYSIQANTLNIPVRSVSINENFQVNTQTLIDSCSLNTSMIFLANPNNPTGSLISPRQIENLLSNIPASTLLVLDEAYYEYAASEYAFDSTEWLKTYPNLVITRTFSKIYGLAGLRLGYALAHPSIINILHRVQLPFMVNQAALTTAHAALDDHEFIKLSLDNNVQGMQQMRLGFKKLAIDYLPSCCNFLTFNCKEDGNVLYEFLLKKGIIVRPLHAYNMNNYIRVTIGTNEQNQRFLDALSGFYNSRNKNG